MRVLTANLIWLVAAVALMHWSRRSDGTGSGPYVRCPWCRMWYQACEPACPSWSVRIGPSPMTGNPILLIGGGALMLRRNR